MAAGEPGEGEGETTAQPLPSLSRLLSVTLQSENTSPAHHGLKESSSSSSTKDLVRPSNLHVLDTKIATVMSVEEGKLLPVKHLAYFTKTRQTPRSRQRETSLDQESEPLGPALSPLEPGLLCKVGTLVVTMNWIWCLFDNSHFHF